MWKTDKKCPKCGCKNFQITDYCRVGYLYECRNGVIEADGQCDSCDRISIECYCRNCGHSWHPKGDVFQSAKID